MDTATQNCSGHVLVTGASGFIGQHFVRQSLAAGLKIIAVSRQPATVQDTPALSWIQGGLESVSDSTLLRCSTLVHLAANGVLEGGNDWSACFETNVHQSISLWRRAASAGVGRMVICGSCFEYGRSGERFERIPVSAPLEPVTAYAASKAAATCAALALAVEAGISLAVLRPFHVYGDGEADGRFWPALRAAAISGRDFPMTLGKQIRDFTPVDLVAQVFVEHARTGGLKPGIPVIRNVGTGRPQSLLEFAQDCWTAYGARGRLLPGAIPMRVNEVMRYVPDISFQDP